MTFLPTFSYYAPLEKYSNLGHYHGMDGLLWSFGSMTLDLDCYRKIIEQQPHPPLQEGEEDNLAPPSGGEEDNLAPPPGGENTLDPPPGGEDTLDPPPPGGEEDTLTPPPGGEEDTLDQPQPLKKCKGGSTSVQRSFDFCNVAAFKFFLHTRTSVFVEVRDSLDHI